MQFYLAAGAGDALPRGRFCPVRAAYRLGARLLSAVGNTAVQGGLMLVGDSRECGPDDVLARDILRECLRRNYDGVVLDWYHNGPDRGTLTALMGQLCLQYDRRLFVPERYAAHAPRATVLLNTAVSGGTLHSCLSEGVRRFGAERLVVLTDSSKWGIVGLSSMAELSDASVVVTDSGLPAHATEAPRAQGTRRAASSRK